MNLPENVVESEASILLTKSLNTLKTINPDSSDLLPELNNETVVSKFMLKTLKELETMIKAESKNNDKPIIEKLDKLIKELSLKELIQLINRESSTNDTYLLRKLNYELAIDKDIFVSFNDLYKNVPPTDKKKILEEKQTKEKN